MTFPPHVPSPPDLVHATSPAIPMGSHIAIGDTDQLVSVYTDLFCAHERTSTDDGRLHFRGCPSGFDYEVPRKVWGSLALPIVIRLTMERWWESSQT